MALEKKDLSENEEGKDKTYHIPLVVRNDIDTHNLSYYCLLIWSWQVDDS